MDQTEKKGNAVKMTLTSQIQKEQSCYNKSRPQKTRDQSAKGKIDWDLFVPK
jgi:hypothetical protein